MMNKNDNTIDILKLIMSVLVVGIHIHMESMIPDERMQSFFSCLTLRTAVPFFFVVTGYYLGKKLWNRDAYERQKYMIGYIKRLLPPFLFWGGISWIFLFEAVYSTCSNVGVFILKFIRQMCFYPPGTTWYILACMVGAGMIYFLWKHPRMLLAMILPLYGVALLGSTYYFVIDHTKIMDIYLKIFISTRNGIFVGFPFMYIGILLAKPLFLERINIKRVSLVTIACYVLLILENSLVYGRNYIEDRELYITYLLFIPCVVILAVKKKILGQKDTKLLRKLSTCIYFTHNFYVLGFKQWLGMEDGFLLFAVVIVCSILTYMLSNKVTILKKVL